MKICLFTPSFLPKVGGMEIVIDRLARAFVATGHEVTVLAKTPRSLAPGEHTGGLRGATQTGANPACIHAGPKDTPYPVVYYPRSRSQVWLLNSTKRALLAEHARKKFDIIHAHQAYPTGHVAVQLRSALGVPVVITSHRGDIGEASRYRRRWVTRRRMVDAMRQADAVTGVSAELKDMIDELTGRAARSVIIPNGVDLDAPVPADPPSELAAINGKPFMLTLGRLHPYKGLDVLLDAIAMLRGRGVEAPHLVIAGDGKIGGDLERQADRLGLTQRVTFAGAVFGEAKNWLLARCAFFVQPSREEGMPLTVLEAMAAGRPIIGSDLPGIRQLVRPGRSGVLAAVGSPASLADALANLLADADAVARMGAAARAEANTYAWPTIANRYLDLFGSLIVNALPSGSRLNKAVPTSSLFV